MPTRYLVDLYSRQGCLGNDSTLDSPQIPQQVFPGDSFKHDLLVDDPLEQKLTFVSDCWSFVGVLFVVWSGARHPRYLYVFSTEIDVKVLEFVLLR